MEEEDLMFVRKGEGIPGREDKMRRGRNMVGESENWSTLNMTRLCGAWR